jgi:hypothetical protein
MRLVAPVGARKHCATCSQYFLASVPIHREQSTSQGVQAGSSDNSETSLTMAALNAYHRDRQQVNCWDTYALNKLLVGNFRNT